jgi:predicted transcriptional regulator
MKEKLAHSFYFPAEVLAKLKIIAQEQRRSVNFIVNEILAEWLARKGEPK